MNNFIYTIRGGGVWSRILQCAIEPLVATEFDNVYFILEPIEEHTGDDQRLPEAVQAVLDHKARMREYGIDNPYDHILNFVLDQEVDQSYENKGMLHVGVMHDRRNPIETSPWLPEYRRVLSKIRFKNHLRSRADAFARNNNIGPRTLGVHVRLTTMVFHIKSGNYPEVNFDSYCNIIDEEMRSGLYDNIYVASDNDESIIKLKLRYGDLIVSQPDMLRLETETIAKRDDWNWEYHMFFNKTFWQESVVEVLTLSKCGGLICTDSNFSNAALLFTDSIAKVRRA